MDIFAQYDPKEGTYAAIGKISLVNTIGFSPVTPADLVNADEALAVYVFSDLESAQAFSATMRTLVHDGVFGNFTSPDVCGESFIVWFVDGSTTIGDECRVPGLHVFDFRRK